ncbi:acyltransferase [Microbaculum marinum]|uniref:Acyltransferase n=1 Tax=Microbaculum marinum TaxID=1764581 RepID=A0AAW9RVS1_9HYPH
MTLDAFRGAAALFVVMHHFPQFFGGWSPQLASSAVDLFFVLSGFVLASAYGDRVATGTAQKQLILLRLVRIYPLYLLGTAIGILSLVLSVVSRGYVSEFHLPFWKAIPFALVMLPSPSFGSLGNVFPLNIPAWSLFFEIVANFYWFLLGRYAARLQLWSVIIVSGIGLFVLRDQLSGGWSHDNFYVGFFRVAYSFAVGLVLFRYRNIVDLRFMPSGFVFLTIFILAMCSAPESARLGIVMVFYPVLVLLAARARVGAGCRAVFEYAGRISYPMYAVHLPMLAIVVAVMDRFAYGPTPLISAVVIFGLVLSCWVADRCYDQPIRRYLHAMLGLK